MKILRLFVCVAMVLALSTLSAAPGLNSIKSQINKAVKLWENDAPKAQQILRDAFADAILWTRDDYVDSVREQGFFLAISCFSPALVEEVSLAADTYCKVFPEGKNLKKVNLYRAMAAYAKNDLATAEAAINAAVKSGKTLTYPEQTFVLNGYFAGSKHRSAEQFIEGQHTVTPSSKLKKDLRRFHSGNRLIEGLLKKVADGKISGSEAVASLETALQTSWFAKEAPVAALTAISIRDNQAPFFNSLRTQWCGLERVVKHAASPQIRLKKLEDFLAGFPQAKADERFKALVDLYYLYRLEFRDLEKAGKVMEQISAMSECAEKAEVEMIISRFNPQSLRTEEGFADIKRLRELAGLLPYDNGTMPVLTFEYLNYLQALADMIHDKNNRITGLTQTGWGKLPVEVLYKAAVGEKEQAFELFNVSKDTWSPQISRLFNDLVFPLYLPLKAKERYFLAGLAAVEILPDLGTDLIVEAISGHPRMQKAEHGFAVLSDIYNRHMAYAEAQKVWKTLAEMYPDSIWLK